MSETVPIRIEEISDSDWAKTPESVKWSLLGRIEQLERQYEELKADNAMLREQLQRNSQNSSKPPSQDLRKRFTPKEKKGNGNQRGAQQGHQGAEPKFYAVEQCETVEEHYPQQCFECGAPLQGQDPDPYRVQSIDIPRVAPVVREYQFHALSCERCGARTRAWDEKIINGSRYGERIVAHVGILSGQYRRSHRMVQALLSELFGIELSIGSVNQLRQESRASVATAVNEAYAYVQQQAHVNMDETSFAQGNTDGNNPERRRGWLWVMVTPWVSYFAVLLSRSSQVCHQLLGETYAGIVSSDRFSAYNGLDLERRQVCWAHLKRDFTQIAERSGESGKLGEALLEQQRLLFEQWYRVRDGTLTRSDFAQRGQPIRDEFHRLLVEGASYDIAAREKTPLAKTVRTSQQLLKVEPALWTFVATEGVEPTNNAAERALRPAVLWRKNSFGSQSAEGSLFVSRMLTVVTSLRAQNRPVLEYLVQACRAAPSLLPTEDCTP
ncbi:MAG: IS66 family transposase [Elainellaceae cyanobacterium]